MSYVSLLLSSVTPRYFALSSLLLGKPWSQVSSLLPPGTCLYFLSRIGLSIPTARRFLSNVATRTLSRFPPINLFMQEKVPTSMHSVRLEPTKWILIGTRTTYQATGDADIFIANTYK